MRLLRSGVLLAVLALAGCDGAPDIDVAETHDMGTVTKGEIAAADLSVRNHGDGPLTVLGISTSCGCTKASLTPMVIPAGGEGRLRIEYDSAAHERDLGRIERSVFVSSDDPDEDDIQIRFVVFVRDGET